MSATATDAGAAGTGVRPAWVSDERLAEWCTWVARDPAGTATSTAVAPYDGLVTATVPASTAEDVATAIAGARRAQRSWARLPWGTKAAIVLRFHDLLVQRQDEAIDLVQWEMGKARFSAWQEILQVATIARHYARHGRHYLADNKVRGAIPGLTKVREVRVPKGVIGMISPWNYPLYLAVGDVLPALLAGNGVVSKADSQTPLTLLWARALMAEAGLPRELWQVVVGPGSVVGDALIGPVDASAEGVDHICFTGSTATGRGVGRRAGERLIAASLELGGKNPLLVLPDADVEKAAAGCVAAAFANTGQMCIHVERVIVHTDVYDAFRDALVAATAALRVGQSFDYSVDVGSLASPAQLETVRSHVETAVAAGAQVLIGGRHRPDLGPLVYEPTVLEGVTEEMPVCAEETFGPVLSLYRAVTEADALAKANAGRYGLSASIWSRDTAAAERLATSVRAGSVNVNDGAAAAAGSIEAPMGGMGDSGLGRRHGAEGIRKYTEQQTIATQRLMPLGPPPWMPVERFVGIGNAQMRLLRSLRMR
ncbi:succinate-semialdehyde dehydrogenase (NADP(+)) [Nocardioides sp. zg-536]|uniref:Succinate-semialdehyde dehydrogenase (NADP(+)) n=1 Tax=Nocardioides faecalis TaxID=2803858 RepID=A0A938Y893_9ACTN|nr:succinic semialdehyde dehydrogenase [Nocardioides faecalis]MBM9459306.1 succinate-semialdehyde dehydrogenase (NADP(+)) [Nocardioides faecalis]QVI59570.1 succinate-semialdehyde dehydrogenase (NADP(+)) [Nocardioides faecalis]